MVALFQQGCCGVGEGTLKNVRTWRLGLLALYLVATLIAALLPAGHGVSAQSTSQVTMSVDCDDMNAVVTGATHTDCGQANHNVPDNCASGSLCHMAHLWVPDASTASVPSPIATREVPPLTPLPLGIVQAPDLRPPRLSA
jgi:hypothetical protein